MEAQMQSRLKQMRSRLLREELGLDEARASEAETVMDGFAPQRKGLRQTLRTHRRALRTLEETQSTDDEAYVAAVDGLVTAERQLQVMRAQEFDALRLILDGREQAHLLHAFKKMKRHMRKMKRDNKKGRFKGDRRGPKRRHGDDGFGPSERGDRP